MWVYRVLFWVDGVSVGGLGVCGWVGHYFGGWNNILSGWRWVGMSGGGSGWG